MNLSIAVEHVSVRFGNRLVLDDISFQLDGTTIYGLLGRNGAGKSTLLATLAALRRPDRGLVLANGTPVFENADLTRQIVLIRESPDVLDPDEKLHYNLKFAEVMRPSWDRTYAAELIERFEIPSGQKISTFSRGQRSALGIVLGLASRAPVTLFDESYLGLDTPSRYRFYDELLADFMQFPRTFVLSTHLIEEVAPIFESVLVLDRGKMIVQQRTDALLARGRRYTGRAELVERLLAGETIRHGQQLGSTVSAVVVSDHVENLDARARADGIESEMLGLQDLFVYLTQQEESVR